jgi:DNA-binding transcriptional MerR regulator
MSATQEFDSNRTARLSGLSRVMVDYLARMRVVVPTIRSRPGRGRPRLYSFGDLVTLRAVSALLEAGVSVKGLRRVMADLQEAYGKSLGECPGRYLVTDGKRLYFRESGQSAMEIATGGQKVFLFMCDLQQIHTKVEQATMGRRKKAAS